MKRVEECMNRLKGAKRVVYDAETSGLAWNKNHVVGHVLTFGPGPSDSYYLPVRHCAGGNISDSAISSLTGWSGEVLPIEKEIIRELDRPGIKVGGHNLSFDLKFLYRLGLRFNAKFEDSMINAVLLNEWQPSVGLDACCKAMGVAQKKTTIYDYILSKFPEAVAKPKAAMGHFWRLAGDDPQAVEYAETDGTATWQLLDKQLISLETEDLMLVHGVECRTIPVLARMMCRGIKINEKRIEEVKAIVAERKAEARKKLPEDFNTRSMPQVRALMEKNGHTDWPYTPPTPRFPQGNPSFTEQWLVTNPVGRTIIEIRKLENLENSFLNPMLESHLCNGRVHTEFHQLRGDEYGTVTGRLSSSNPNLQQVSKRNKDLGKLHRSIFVPDDGLVWGSVDYSQMEPKLLAYYSEAKALIEGYNADPPIDAHQTAANLAGIDRETGKRVNQTLITGGGANVLESKYGVKDARAVMQKYFEALPEIKVLQRKASYKMAEQGYIRSLLGRKCRLNDPNKSYVAVNRLLQTGNADCLKLKMCEIDEYLRSEGDDKCQLLCNCHDAFEFQFDPAHRQVYDGSLKIMTSFGPKDVICLPIPITVDHGEGADWAAATWTE